MTGMTLEGHQGRPVAIDLCMTCQAFWFDKYENLQIAPGSTLQLMKLIGERPATATISVSSSPKCPRCADTLPLARDMVRNTRFTYWRCPKGHGHFIRFFEFLREKNFIRTLNSEQIAELREHIQILNCSNCGAPIDLSTSSACGHCGSEISIVDLKQSQELLMQLQQAAQPKPVDPALPLDLLKAKREMEFLFPRQPEPLLKEISRDLVHACLATVAGWLNKPKG
jgi:hypothetical protein